MSISPDSHTNIGFTALHHSVNSKIQQYIKPSLHNHLLPIKHYNHFKILPKKKKISVYSYSSLPADLVLQVFPRPTPQLCGRSHISFFLFKCKCSFWATVQKEFYCVKQNKPAIMSLVRKTSPESVLSVYSSIWTKWENTLTVPMFKSYLKTVATFWSQNNHIRCHGNIPTLLINLFYSRSLLFFMLDNTCNDIKTF